MGFPFSLYRKYIFEENEYIQSLSLSYGKPALTHICVVHKGAKNETVPNCKKCCKYKDFFTGHLAKLKFAIRLPCVKGAVSEC